MLMKKILLFPLLNYLGSICISPWGIKRVFTVFYFWGGGGAMLRTHSWGISEIKLDAGNQTWVVCVQDKHTLSSVLDSQDPFLFSLGCIQQRSGLHMWCWRLNPAQLHEWQTSYVLACLSSLEEFNFFFTDLSAYNIIFQEYSFTPPKINIPYYIPTTIVLVSSSTIKGTIHWFILLFLFLC